LIFNLSSIRGVTKCGEECRVEDLNTEDPSGSLVYVTTKIPSLPSIYTLPLTHDKTTMAIKVSPLKKIGERLHNIVQISRQIDKHQEKQIKELNECDELCNQAAEQCMKLLIQGK
jgi:hypothetical protein